MSDQLVSAPESTDRETIEPFGYIESHDDVVDKTYAYAVWKSTNPETGKWYLNIKATVTAHTKLDPDHPSVRTNMAKAAVNGQMYSVFGFNFQTKDDDKRVVENRLHFDENLKPLRVTMHLVTRNADESPKEEQTIEFPWPGEDKEEEQKITPPKSSDHTEVTQLAYLNSYDPFIDKDYAYVAYTEKKTATGAWVFKISAKSTAGAQLDPNHSSFQSMIDKAAAAGQDHMVFGFQLEPKDDDPRKVQKRLYFDGDKKPTHVEIEVITRKIDGSPTEPKIARIDWPA